MPRQVINSGPSTPQPGLSDLFCHIAYPDGTSALLGLSTALPTVPTIAATFLKTSPPVNFTALNVTGGANPANPLCTAYGGAQASNVGFLSFTNAQGATDMCVFGDGSRVSAFTLAYVSLAAPGSYFAALRAAIYPAQVFFGISPLNPAVFH
jgi:hypothetical protein